MFNQFFIDGRDINSTCADGVHVDALSGTAVVVFKDGREYRYENVSRRAIIKFIMDDARSLGKFINNVLMQERVQVLALNYWSWLNAS